MTFFFFNDTATTEIYTLSLHDALPISLSLRHGPVAFGLVPFRCLLERSGHALDFPAYLVRPSPSCGPRSRRAIRDRKSTRLNSSHGYISYAVFCLKKIQSYSDAAQTSA